MKIQTNFTSRDSPPKLRYSRSVSNRSGQSPLSMRNSQLEPISQSRSSMSPSLRKPILKTLNLEKISMPEKNNFENSKPKPELDHWVEIRPTGKKLERRCYHSAVVFGEYLYIYGGYEYNAGILQDFYRIKLGDSKSRFICERVPIASPKLIHYDALEEDAMGDLRPVKRVKLLPIVYPGPRARHSAIVYKEKMYMFGGQKNTEENTSAMYSFEFATYVWEQIEPKGSNQPPPLDSHSAAIWEDKSTGDTPKTYMIVFGGFIGGRVGDYSNHVLRYDFEDNSWQTLFKNKSVRDIAYPSKRMGQDAAVLDDNLYIFGGTDADIKFGDLWKFDLKTLKWKHILPEGTLPEPRSGLKLVPCNNKLILFGGIQELTHEKNDLFLFDISAENWTLVEEDPKQDEPISGSARLKKSVSQINIPRENVNSPGRTRSPLIKREAQSMNQISMVVESPPTNERQRSLKIFSDSEPRPVIFKDSLASRSSRQLMTKSFEKIKLAPVKPLDSMMLNQSANLKVSVGAVMKRHKALQASKKIISQELYVAETERHLFFDRDPTTDQMKKSLKTVESVQLGLSNRGPDFDFQKNFMLEFMKKGLQMQIPDSKGRVVGSKPRARDGHTCSLYGNYMIIFGGDRHKMCFDDLFLLNLNYFDKSS